MNRAASSVQRGLSLIEILVALAIGSVLVLGLVEVFSASRAAYQLSTGLARVQENGRFAMDFLQRDLRMAGHLGCVNDQARFLPSSTTGGRLALASTFVPPATPALYTAAPPQLRFDFGLRGYEATNSAPGNSQALATTPVVASAATAWTPAVNAAIFTDMMAGDGKPIAGSDVVELRFLLPSGAQMGAFDPAAGTLTFPSQGTRLVEGAENPQLFGISDCMNAAVFRGVLTPSSTTPTGLTVAAGGVNLGTLTGKQPFVAGQARIHRAESIVYFIGLNPRRSPSLYRLRYGAEPATGNLTSVKEELVEGIESLQLRYGQDSRTDITQTPTGNIGSSVVASAILPDATTAHSWRRVGMVQVGLVARSAEPAAAEQRAAGTTQLSALGLALVPPNDTYYRAVYEDTIAVRNRLFGN